MPLAIVFKVDLHYIDKILNQKIKQKLLPYGHTDRNH